MNFSKLKKVFLLKSDSVSKCIENSDEWLVFTLLIQCLIGKN